MARITDRFISVFFASLIGATIFSAPASAARISYFDMTSKRSDNLVPFPKWTGVVTRFDKEKKQPESECDQRQYHPCVIKEWSAMLDEVREKSFRDQLDAINEWGNAHPYIIDQLNWGMEDYWETPYQFMEVNGDCEDYAIAKYYSLRALGLPDDRMRIIIVQDLNLGGIIHAILGVYDGDELLILDNQSKQVIPALNIYHYRPIYGVNHEWWWAYYPKV